MDLFSLICAYIRDYIFTPMDNWFASSGVANSYISDYYLYFYEGKLTIGSPQDNYVDAYGNVFELYGINLLDLFTFVTVLVIFILLFIVAVKFIVWLFKQISFVTRF